MLRHLDDPKALPALSAASRAAARALLLSRPPFFKLADWVLLDQLHGPKARLRLCALQRCSCRCCSIQPPPQPFHCRCR